LHYLPNKKFILIAVISFLIIGGGFFVLKNYGSGKSRQITEQKLSPASEPVIAQEIDKDSDNDGLPDWEEALWKTDFNNPDTDGDGVFDGQEVKEGRNPLVAGNGKTDKIQNPNPEKPPIEQTAQLPSTLTVAFGKEFFSEYMRLKQESGGELSQASKTEFVNSMASALGDVGKNTDDYLESDIKIASSDDEKTIREYGNNLALLIKKYFDPLPETEMTIFQRSLEKRTEDELKKLEPIADAYSNTAKEMTSLTTPASFSKSHLELINYFSNIAKELNEMQRFFTDPMQATLAFPRYQENAEKAYFILLDLNAYFFKNKIVFEKNEPAEFFKIYVAAAVARTNQQ